MISIRPILRYIINDQPSCKIELCRPLLLLFVKKFHLYFYCYVESTSWAQMHVGDESGLLTPEYFHCVGSRVLATA